MCVVLDLLLSSRLMVFQESFKIATEGSNFIREIISFQLFVEIVNLISHLPVGTHKN